MYCNCTKLLTIVRYGLSMSSEVPVVMLRCSGGVWSLQCDCIMTETTQCAAPDNQLSILKCQINVYTQHNT